MDYFQLSVAHPGRVVGGGNGRDLANGKRDLRADVTCSLNPGFVPSISPSEGPRLSRSIAIEFPSTFSHTSKSPETQYIDFSQRFELGIRGPEWQANSRERKVR